MNQNPVRVSRIHWTHVFPFLRLLQAGSLGCSATTLVLAWMCLAISWAGSHWICRALADNDADGRLLHAFPVDDLAEFQRGDDRLLPASPRLQSFPGLVPSTVNCLASSASHALLLHSPWHPTRISPRHADVNGLLAVTLMIWNAAVLGFFGTAIARSTTARFCRDKRTGSRQSIRFAVQSSGAMFLSSGLMVLFPGACRGMLWLTGLMAGLGTTGSAAINVVWLLVVLLAFLLVLAFAVGFVAWMLSLGAIATDQCSGADALSRSISYVLSHRLLTLTSLLAVMGVALAISWIFELILTVALNALPRELPDADTLRRLCMLVVNTLPEVVQLAVFLSGMSILYVLLRQKEDGIRTEEMDAAA